MYSNMRPCCNFICLILFAFCSLARSEFSQGPDKCCFSFSNVRIPVKQVESYHITHFECHTSGIILITKAQKEICADPTERWVQRLKNLVDAQRLKDQTERWVQRLKNLVDAHRLKDQTERWVQRLKNLVDAHRLKDQTERWVQRLKNLVDAHRLKDTLLIEIPVTSSKLDTVAKKAESIRTTETAPLQQPEETTLVHLKESNEGFDFDTTQANPNTEMAFELIGTRGATTVVHLEESHYWSLGKQGVPTSLNDAKFNQESIRTTETTPLQQPEKTTFVHLKESNDGIASESFCTRGTTTLQRADESAVVHLKESAYFCMQPEGE